AFNVTIRGNYIGTNAAGDAALGNRGSGVRLFGAGAGNFIGDTSLSGGNVISSNLGGGIQITDGSSVTISSNNIGTSASGDAPLGNTGNGIYSNRATKLVIGGGDGGSNLIGANKSNGILLTRTPA